MGTGKGGSRAPIIALPSEHAMGLAPLDVWARLLTRARWRVSPAYWPRLAWILFTSAVSTLITLPERLVLWSVLRARTRGVGAGGSIDLGREVVVVLGYYRSGTTHLHYLLSCHPDLSTPRWHQAMVPQGWVLSWAFLRWALIPFLPNTRPQDDVAFGPDWPAEDDFALCNWSLASSFPGRFVVPADRVWWSRWHDLSGLRARERAAFRRTLAGFLWKLLPLARARRLLLKTPSHTARVAELDSLFGGRVRFVHLSRRAEDVVRSNEAMHARLASQALQALPAAEETREHIIREYVETERRCAREGGALPAERFVRLAYEDLVADPMGTMGRVCARLGLRWDDEVRARAASYLAGVAAYRSASDRRGERAEPASDPRLEELDRMLSSLVERSVHAAPARKEAPAAGRGRVWRGIVAAWIVAALCVPLWLGLASVTHRRIDQLVWLFGGVVGYAALRAAGRGTRGVGIHASVATLAIVLATAWPMPEVAHGWVGRDRIANLRTSYGSPNNNYVWMAFGVLTAWRFGTRKFIAPPGM